jgi:riboflavin kinase/FMN adenylyltransferase
MKIVDGLEALELRPRVIALGTFDGVHLGHKRLIHEALERAQELGATSTVATFEPMPSEILRPGQVPRRLSGIDRRAELIAAEGVDELLVIAFTHELSLLSPEAFAEQVLVARAGAVHVVVGENYRFGHAAGGDAETLVALGQKLGFGVTSVSLVTADGERVSSSWIRELVRQGEVMHATRLLGRPPWLDGTVVRGFARGRALGVPTANLRWTPGRVVPAPGIYAGFGVLGPGEGERYPAAISVGGNPTFGDVDGTVVEAYLIGFDGDAYDRPLRVEFTRFLRHELAFETVEELVEQMWRDIETARALAEESDPAG